MRGHVEKCIRYETRATKAPIPYGNGPERVPQISSRSYCKVLAGGAESASSQWNAGIVWRPQFNPQKDYFGLQAVSFSAKMPSVPIVLASFARRKD